MFKCNLVNLVSKEEKHEATNCVHKGKSGKSLKKSNSLFLRCPSPQVHSVLFFFFYSKSHKKIPQSNKETVTPNCLSNRKTCQVAEYLAHIPATSPISIASTPHRKILLIVTGHSLNTLITGHLLVQNPSDTF